MGNDSDGEGCLMADDIEVCKFTGICRGVLLWISLHYVFNFSYPKGSKKTLVFIQKMILGIYDKEALPLTVMNISKQLTELVTA